MSAPAQTADRKARVLYPAIPDSYFGRCTHCLRRRDDIAVRAHPEDPTELRRLCTPCARALAAGERIELSVEELEEIWPWLARQHNNQKVAERERTPLEETGVTDWVVDAALGELAPHLTLFGGWLAIEELEDALLKLQKAEDGLDVLTLEPEWQDAETYVNHLHGLVDDAVHKLTGRTA